jgi:Ribbon-helix-helix protein, copG family
VTDRNPGPGRPSIGPLVRARIPPDLLTAIDQAATAQGIPRAEMIRQLLTTATRSNHMSITPDHDKALSYHPLTAGRGAIHEELRAAAKAYAAVIDDLCPPSREASLAFTAAQEALMWANASVAIHDDPDAP